MANIVGDETYIEFTIQTYHKQFCAENISIHLISQW